MGFGRYSFNKKVNGRFYKTNEYASAIRRGVVDGSIPYSTKILAEGERLDTIAGNTYGDGRLWWVIAAASGIGWGLQVPPGTLIFIPDNTGQIFSLI
jgi:nucleoid-associated protein YgaU